MKTPVRFLTMSIVALAVIGAALVIVTGSSNSVLASFRGEAAAGDPTTVSSVPWKAVAASGEVDARPSGDAAASWGRVKRGAELAPRTLLRTGRRGRATLTQHAHVLMMEPESQVELPPFVTQDGPSSVIQPSGSVMYEIDGSRTRDFRVVTPYLVAGVKGTVFLVTVSDRYATVTVERGEVDVTSARGGETSRVRAGETVLVEEDARAMEHVSRRTGGERDDVDRQTRKLARHESLRLDRMLDERDLILGEEKLVDAIEEERARDRDNRQDDLLESATEDQEKEDLSRVLDLEDADLVRDSNDPVDRPGSDLVNRELREPHESAPVTTRRR